VPDETREAFRILRSKAEERLHDSQPAAQFRGTFVELAQELSIHQAELEVQNEELRRMAAELEHSRDRYYQLYDLAPVGYLRLSPTGRVEEANRTAAAMLGTSKPRLSGASLHRFVAAEYRDALRRHLRAVFAEGGGHKCELLLHGPAGSLLHVQLESSASDEGATSLSARTIMIDVTAQRRAESEASRFMEEMSDLQAHLRHAQRIETLGKAVAGVAHDLNNLLGIAAGYVTEALRTVGADHAAAEDIRRARHAALAAVGIVSQLNDLAREETGPPHRVELDAAVRRLADLMGPLLLGVHVKLSLNASRAQLLCPRGSLDRIVLNLAVNAHDAMPEGGHLTFETRLLRQVDNPLPGTGSSDVLQLTVRDTGHGMSEEVMSHLFDPFFTTKPGRGSGLGLTTVRQLVGQMGGRVQVQSRPGAGTSFVLDFPVSPA
jgi:two-component system, cell cycle sensor histidine kinase and response regulator CckA